MYSLDCRVIGDLGSGEFGNVYEGRWHSPGGPINVAIKTLKCHSTEKTRVRFLQEAAIMGQFHHPNIVKLHGVVTLREPVSSDVVYMKMILVIELWLFAIMDFIKFMHNYVYNLTI